MLSRETPQFVCARLAEELDGRRNCSEVLDRLLH
jgi:hypothetical protein